jgi:hypothetical protein
MATTPAPAAAPTTGLTPAQHAGIAPIPTPAQTTSEETPAVSTEEGTPAAPAVEVTAKKVEQALRKKLKLKVDGKEIEDEVDLEDEEGLTKKFQLAHVAQKRMAEKAQLEKEVREFIDLLRKDPRKVLSDPNLGIDLKQFAASIIQEEIENSNKSPEVLEKEKAQRELKELREENARKDAEYKRLEMERLNEVEFQRYDNQMSQALEKSDLPKSPYVVKKMADYMLLGLQNNMNLSPEDVLPIVREEIISDVKAMFGAMPQEVVEKIIGKEFITAMRKKSLAKPRTPTAPKIVDSGTKPAKKTDDKKKPVMDYKSFFGV